jgi:hypothetical protein
LARSRNRHETITAASVGRKIPSQWTLTIFFCSAQYGPSANDRSLEFAFEFLITHPAADCHAVFSSGDFCQMIET